MTIVRIVADDLTGALDAAAPLVGLTGPLPVLWNESQVSEAPGSFALDSESRDRPPPTESWLAALGGAELAFKKIDSLLRGRTLDEIAACLNSGRFASAVIAPAFPAQGRITRGGRQYWRAAPTGPWQPVEVELLAELRRRARVPVVHAPSGAPIAGSGFFLCDAITEADLAAIARAGAELARPVLWIGTAGLARALAGASARPVDAALAAPLLIVVGSHHPVALAQVEQLAAHAPEAMTIIRLDGTVLGPAVEGLADALSGRGRAALVFALPDGTGAELAGPLFDRVMALAIERVTPPRSLVVTGGATLFRLARVLGASSLRVRGELMPGIALSRLEGGRWPGAAVLSKSGAFGAPDLLVRCWQRAQS